MMTRRKFLNLASTAAAIAGVPAAIRAVSAAAASDSGGGADSEIGGLTPAGDFYVTSYASTPRVDSASWQLKIHGLVANPLALDYGAVKSLPAIDERLTLECIGNGPGGSAIGNAQWVGPKLKPILEKARPSAKAVYAAMRAADGYYTGVPVDELMREENFMPYLMNGAPLPPAHGYPVRIFIPGKYGMKQPKWITEIEFVDREFVGYWEARGWSNSAWRRVNSGFLAPKPRYGLFSLMTPQAEVSAPVDVAGWALAGPSGIKRVEVSTDAGASWNAAELTSSGAPYIWTIWHYRFAPKAAGRYHLMVRATDGAGNVQSPEDSQSGAGTSAEAELYLVIT